MSSFPKSMHLLDMKINYLILIVMLSLEFSVLDIFSQFHLTLLGPGYHVKPLRPTVVVSYLLRFIILYLGPG